MEQVLLPYLDFLFVDHPVMTVIGVIILLAGVAMAFANLERKFGDWRRKRRAAKQLLIDREIEQDHINSLPRLRTDFLLKVEGTVCPGSARSFGSRYDRLVIYDEWGQMWVGLRTPEIMEDLFAAEFTLNDYWVPFCGPGEAFRSKPVEVDGLTMNLYPNYLFGKNSAGREWAQWKKIELNDQANRKANRRSRNYNDVIGYSQSEKWRRHRRYLGTLVPE